MSPFFRNNMPNSLATALPTWQMEYFLIKLYDIKEKRRHKYISVSALPYLFRYKNNSHFVLCH